jgi:hypothetical protein
VFAGMSVSLLLDYPLLPHTSSERETRLRQANRPTFGRRICAIETRQVPAKLRLSEQTGQRSTRHYQVSAGEVQRLMLRIKLRAEPFFTPLIIGLGNGYGTESARLALLRWPRPIGDSDSPTDALIDDFFRRHFKIDLNFLH